MSFRMLGLDPAPFRHLYGLSDEELKAASAVRYRVDQPDAFPDRVELADAKVGETVLLVNHMHQPADTPYKSSHAIFVREGALERRELVDEVPNSLRIRPLSLRAFDAEHMMVAGQLVDGAEAAQAIETMLARPKIRYIQAHFARRGCYAAHIEPIRGKSS